MKFLHKIISELLDQHSDLSDINIVLPGKRPIVFIKRILQDKQYSGFLPNFFSIEELIAEIAGKTQVKGISLWLFAFEVYREIQPSEDFASFLKWFVTISKDWDDMLKFSENDQLVIESMVNEEKMKNWSENLGEAETPARKKYLNFWQKMNLFLPILKAKLLEKGWATNGMIHEITKNKIESFAQDTKQKFVFCGFNALTPVEEKLIKNLLQWDKAQCFFQADRYYFDDEKQEAGKFLRAVNQWKEFHENRNFKWIEDDFSQPKNIKVYEVPGNITQTKVLPEIFNSINQQDLTNTAVVLLDENLLPASLDVLSSVQHLNITMGFPIKNLSFSIAVKNLFYLQKQLEKKDSSYYYHEVLSVLEEFPNDENDKQIVAKFKSEIEEKNIVYLTKNKLNDLLSGLSYLKLFEKAKSVQNFLDLLIDVCHQLKFRELDDILFENITHFEKSFKIIKNQLTPYQYEVKMETLEVLINQLVNSEIIDFEGEPLQGLQVMGLLETRLLNFENVIMLSVNEGKLPLGNSQNTYLPFDLRQHFKMQTFLENDSIYAYHFYRLLQDSQNVHLLFNALSSGVNTGEQSRFITQLEIEDRHHEIEKLVIENHSDPIQEELIRFQKTPAVIEKLDEWKDRVSASHLTSYTYNPIDFYLTKVLGTKETSEIEEELSQRTYGNLVHFALQEIYQKLIGQTLKTSDLEFSTEEINEVIKKAIIKLNHQVEYYDRGMNFIHKSIAERVVRSVLAYDRKLIEKGNTLEIVAVEGNFKNIEFYLDAEQKDLVKFYGFIDRIDRLNGSLRIIDYKTGKTKNLTISTPKTDEHEEKLEKLFSKNENKQGLQLSIYAYSILTEKLFPDQMVQCGIWSFAEVNKGFQPLTIFGENEISLNLLEKPMNSVKSLIEEILDPSVDFIEKIQVNYQ